MAEVDSILRRLLVSATKTNYTAVDFGSLWTRLSVLFPQPSGPAATVRAKRNFCPSLTRFGSHLWIEMLLQLRALDTLLNAIERARSFKNAIEKMSLARDSFSAASKSQNEIRRKSRGYIQSSADEGTT